jgi:hypothetical protein
LQSNIEYALREVVGSSALLVSDDAGDDMGPVGAHAFCGGFADTCAGTGNQSDFPSHTHIGGLKTRWEVIRKTARLSSGVTTCTFLRLLMSRYHQRCRVKGISGDVVLRID